MKSSDFDKLVEFVNVGGGLTPHNERAEELLEQSSRGEVFTFKEMTERDLKFHNCYFSLLRTIYRYLPPGFQKKVSEKNFYKWLKHLKGEYNVLFTYKDGTKLVEYDSLAFGNMSQKRFEEYIREQLPWIYENVIGAFFEGPIYDGILETIEEEYKKFLSLL